MFVHGKSASVRMKLGGTAEVTTPVLMLVGTGVFCFLRVVDGVLCRPLWMIVDRLGMIMRKRP